MHLKISSLGCRLKLSNSISGCKVAVPHILLNLRPPIASHRLPHERKCAFQLFIPFLTSVSPLETKTAVQDCQTALGQLKSTIGTSIVYGQFSLTKSLNPTNEYSNFEN
jgi:hypothetical protein